MYDFSKVSNIGCGAVLRCSGVGTENDRGGVRTGHDGGPGRLRRQRRIGRGDAEAGRRRLRRQRGQQLPEVLGRARQGVRGQAPRRQGRRQRLLLERRRPQGQGDGRRRQGARHGADRRVRRLRRRGPALQGRRPALHPRPGRLRRPARRRGRRSTGVQYGMPFAASTRLLFYNKTLFAEAGLTPPTTWKRARRRRRGAQGAGREVPVRAAPRARRRRRPRPCSGCSAAGAATPTPSARTASTPRRTSTTLHLAQGRPRRQGPDRAGRAREAQPGRRRSPRSPPGTSACSTATPR